MKGNFALKDKPLGEKIEDYNKSCIPLTRLFCKMFYHKYKNTKNEFSKEDQLKWGRCLMEKLFS